jgi:uncharacterized membrane protein
MATRPRRNETNGKIRPEPLHVKRTIETVVEMEQRQREPSSFSDWLGEVITAASGRLWFAIAHVVWFTTWIIWNSGPFGLPSFDPMPYSFLTLIVSLEAIFLSTFVLIGQNLQAARAERRSVVDLEVNVIAERELTKILRLVADLHRHLSTDTHHDPEIDQMLKSVRVEDLEEGAQLAERSLSEDDGKAAG